MRKILVMALPVVTICLFVAVMLSGHFLKYSFGADDNIPESIAIVLKDVNLEDWEAADQNADHLEKAWQQVVKRVQFSSERDEINTFSVSIARLRGAIQAKDRTNALMELHQAYEHWSQLSN